MSNRSLILITALILLVSLCVGAYAVTLSGPDCAFKSCGAKSDAGGWEMKSNGYVGTLVRVEKPTKVTFMVKASGQNAVMHLHVGDKKLIEKVSNADPKDFKLACQLPVGTYRVKIELTDVLRGKDSSLRVVSLDVSDENVALCNERTDKLVLEAADTYAENYRKGDARLVLTDAKGKPLPAGTPVHIKLRRHAFCFGTAVTNALPWDDNWFGENPSPDSDAYDYQQFIATHFNTIVPENAAKWGWTESARDVDTLESVDDMLAFAKRNNLLFRMHNLLWEDQLPRWVKRLLDTARNGATEQDREAAKADLRKQITERINYLIRDRKGQFFEFDGLNESGHKDIFSKAFGDEVVGNILNDAINASDKNTLIYFNEYNTLQWNKMQGYDDEYCNWYKDNIESIRAGMSPSNWKRIGIGLQYYPVADPRTLRESPHSPVRIAQVLQLLSNFEQPMVLTEFSVNRADDAAPKILSDTMRLVFGSEEATGFLVWGFWRPRTLFGSSALVDNDWNITECGKAYEQLLGIHDWGVKDLPSWGTDITINTTSDGKLDFRGFYGDYDITVNGQTRPLTLTKGESKYKLSLASAK